jgi:hypothetical protein
MNTHADKKQEHKSQSVSSASSQMKSSDESTFQFVDNRPEAVAQRKLQEMANNSPQVKQFKAFQEMTNQNERGEAGTTMTLQRKVILDGPSRGQNANDVAYPTIKTSPNFDTNHLVTGAINEDVTRARGTARDIARNTVLKESQLESAILANEDAIVTSTGTDAITQLNFPDGSAKQWIKNGNQVYDSPTVGIKARVAAGETEIHHIHESTIDLDMGNEEAWPSL